jgi:hypothetical protein
MVSVVKQLLVNLALEVKEEAEARKALRVDKGDVEAKVADQVLGGVVVKALGRAGPAKVGPVQAVEEAQDRADRGRADRGRGAQDKVGVAKTVTAAGKAADLAGVEVLVAELEVPVVAGWPVAGWPVAGWPVVEQAVTLRPKNGNGKLTISLRST